MADEDIHPAQRTILSAMVYLKCAVNPKESEANVRFAAREAMKHFMNAIYAWGWKKLYLELKGNMEGEAPLMSDSNEVWEEWYAKLNILAAEKCGMEENNDTTVGSKDRRSNPPG